jgi:hypothetical protein
MGMKGCLDRGWQVFGSADAKRAIPTSANSDLKPLIMSAILQPLLKCPKPLDFT